MPNIYQKLAKARAELKAKNIKASGSNKYAGYSYFDLSDILPVITELELQNGILSVVRYNDSLATLTVYNAENPEEHIEFSSPMSTAELKGCHAVQNLGAVETYVRRYLYLAAYEIVESDSLDKTQGKPDDDKKTTEKKQTAKKSEPIKEEELTPRKKLIAKLAEKGIDVDAYAKEKGLSHETTPERFEELLKELNEEKAEVNK